MDGLSIDPNPSETVLVYWRDDEPLRAVTVKAKGDDIVPMMDAIAGEVITRVRHRRMSLDWVALEAVYMGKNAAVALELAELAGAIRWHFKPYVAHYIVLQTSVIDDACVIYWKKQGERKAAVAAWAKMTARAYGLPALDQHQADALAVGWAAKGIISLTSKTEAA